MKINSNSTAILTGNYLNRAEKALSASSKKLSSGYKINNASDNPSGYALSSKMKAQIRSLEKAGDNMETAVDFIKTADGALNEVHSIIQRMNELSIKAANGTITANDRDAIQQEIDELCSEITRISDQTDFNDNPILNGNYEYRGYLTTERVDVKLLGCSDEAPAGEYSFELNINSEPVYDEEGNPIKGRYKYTYEGVELPTDYNKEFGKQIDGEINGSVLTLRGDGGAELYFGLSGADPGGKIQAELKKVGAMRVQVGDNEGEVIEMNIPQVSLKRLNLDNLDVSTEESAKESISRISYALEYTGSVRAKLGAYQNRLEHAGASLDVTLESLNSSYSTITDTDMAEEMTEYTRLQVMQQASTSMLAQANEFPQQALQLLQ